MNLNKVFIVGRITSDLDLKHTQTSTVLSFSVATNRTWTGKDGKKNEDAEFHNVVAWGKTAELIAKYMGKGSEIMIEGRLATRSWEDKQNVKRKTTEIICEQMQFGAKAGGSKRKEYTDEEDLGDVPEIQLGDEEVKPEDLPF